MGIQHFVEQLIRQLVKQTNRSHLLTPPSRVLRRHPSSSVHLLIVGITNEETHNFPVARLGLIGQLKGLDLVLVNVRKHNHTVLLGFHIAELHHHFLLVLDTKHHSNASLVTLLVLRVGNGGSERQTRLGYVLNVVVVQNGGNNVLVDGTLDVPGTPG